MKKKLVVVVSVFLVFLFLCMCLIPEIYDYIYGYFLFQGIAKNLTVNIKSDIDKAGNVAFWVFNNIEGFESYQRSLFTPVIDDNFLNIYKRGFGHCDQSAHVYATMMHLIGFESKLLMLKDDNGSSPHTVAVVKINGKFMIVDTAFKFIFLDKNKNIIGVDELENSEVFDDYLKVVEDARKVIRIPSSVPKLKPAWFKNGTYFETFPYMGWKKTLRKLYEKISAKFKTSCFFHRLSNLGHLSKYRITNDDIIYLNLIRQGLNG